MANVKVYDEPLTHAKSFLLGQPDLDALKVIRKHFSLKSDIAAIRLALEELAQDIEPLE